MEECRYGQLSYESYHFLIGLPTEDTGSWNTDGTLACESDVCASLAASWKHMAAAVAQWSAMQNMQCNISRDERERRNRLLEAEDQRVRHEPFPLSTSHPQEQ